MTDYIDAFLAADNVNAVDEVERKDGFSGEEISRLEGIDALEYLGRYSRIEG